MSAISLLAVSPGGFFPARKVAMLGSLDHVTRQLTVQTSPTKRSSDFVAHLEQLDRLFLVPGPDNPPSRWSS